MSVPVSPDVAKLVRFWLKIKVFGNIFRVIRHLAKFEPILAIVMPLYLLWQKNYYLLCKLFYNLLGKFSLQHVIGKI